MRVLYLLEPLGEDGGGARIELRREDGQVVTVFDGAVPFHSRKSAEGAPLFAEHETGTTLTGTIP